MSKRPTRVSGRAQLERRIRWGGPARCGPYGIAFLADNADAECPVEGLSTGHGESELRRRPVWSTSVARDTVRSRLTRTLTGLRLWSPG